MENFNQIETNILNKIRNVNDRKSFESVKTEIFGKKGIITELFKKIGSLDHSQRKEYASKLNDLKTKVTQIVEKKLVDFDQSEINKKLKHEKIDITLPGRTYFAGKIHPVSQVIDEVTSIFSEIGFSVEEGPDVENEYYNFSALNTPLNGKIVLLCLTMTSFEILSLFTSGLSVCAFFQSVIFASFNIILPFFVCVIE